MPHPKILIGWTTVDSRRRAKKLATGLVAARLAVCVQVDGPVVSYYWWEGKQTQAKEWRLWIKFSSSQSQAIEAWLCENHPYSTPQWLAIEAAIVARPYREWILENTSSPKHRKKS